jgi:T-complex protein 1 subunit alpha
MIVEAFNNIRNANKENWNKFSIKSINILKNHGKSIFDSQLINGYAIMNMRSSQGKMTFKKGMPLTIKKAKIACLDMNLNKYRLPPGYQILISNPENLEKLRLE